jgi:hypothetical protein
VRRPNGDFSDIEVDQGTLTGAYNLIGPGGSGGLVDGVDHNLVGVADAQLSALGDYGGPTQTMALLPGSPALDAGDPTQLGVADQRGVVRSGGVNIGAYQASASTFLLIAPDAIQAGVPFNLNVTAVDPFGQVAYGYTGTVTFACDDPAAGLPTTTRSNRVSKAAPRFW